MKKLSALILAMVLLFTLTTTAFAAYTPGTYSATAPGFGGDVTVTVTVDENQITDVKIVGDKETVGIGGTAIQELPAVILEAQSADFDGWTGASFTSAAVKAAVGEALAEAKASGWYTSSKNRTAGSITHIEKTAEHVKKLFYDMPDSLPENISVFLYRSLSITTFMQD